MKKKEILYVLMDQFADHEMSFLSQAINVGETGPKAEPKYVNKIVSIDGAAVRSIGGFAYAADYGTSTMPSDFAALVLIGGYGWADKKSDALAPVVAKAMADGRVVGAICNGASWMARQGLLNDVRHTGNGLEELGAWGGDRYTNAAGYEARQAVSDKRVVTANGTGYLEFAREMMLLLDVDDEATVERFVTFMKMGFTELTRPQPRFRFNTVGLFTTCNRQTVDFYTKAFGFVTEWDGIQPNVEMRMGEARIILYPRPDFEQMTSCGFHYPTGLNGTMVLAIDVPTFADVDREFAHALECGATAVMPPTTEPWGQRTCYVADPDGNLVEMSSFEEGD